MARTFSEWLEVEGFGAYGEVFSQQEIDFDVLDRLTEDDLAEMGIPIGARKRVMKAIESYLGIQQTAVPVASTAPISADKPKGATQAENRHMSVMFCDLVGSTALSEQLDPEVLRDVISSFRDTCAVAVSRYDGFLASYLGDGLLIYFGYPQARENDAERAVRAGLDMIDAVTRLSPPDDIELHIRVGIATGYVVAGDLVGSAASETLSVLGDTPNLAARLQSVAEPDTLVVSDSTHRLVKPLFEFDTLGEKELKGISQPVAVWRVVGENTDYGNLIATQDQTPLVGRKTVLGMLEGRWKQASAGDGQVALLSSEAGIGKSRVLGAFVESILDTAPMEKEPGMVFWFCSPFDQNSPLHPIIDQIEKAAGMDKGDTVGQRQDKLESLLASVSMDDEETSSLYAEMLNLAADDRFPLLDLPPQKKRARTFEALIRLLREYAREKPLLVVVEDVQWVDPSTHELLDQMIARFRDDKILLAISYRPEFMPPWSGQANITQYTLNPLNRDDSANMITAVAGGKPLPDEVVQLIMDRTGGVPLFIEELTKNVLETDYLREDEDRHTLVKPLTGISIPESLHDSLLARLDSLAAAKELAQIGAVFGRQFPHELIDAISPLHRSAFDHALDKLVNSGLVARHGFSLEATYEFKNALIRDAAYESLLGSRQREFHFAIAEALENEFSELWEGQPELLAFHFSRANKPARAVLYWQQAATVALERSANREAIVHASEGLKLINDMVKGPKTQATELQLQLTLGPALMTTHGYASSGVTEAYMRAAELAQSLNDKESLFTATWGQWLVQQQGGNIGFARKLADEVLELARELHDLEFRLQAHHAVWTTAFRQGDFVSCLDHAEQGIALFDAEARGDHATRYGGHDAGTCAYNHAALSSWMIGNSEEAVGHAEKAVLVADALAQPFSQALARLFSALLYRYRDEPEAARRYAEGALDVSKANGFGQLVAQAEIVRGWAIARQGDPAAGIVVMNDAFERLIAAGAGQRRGSFLPILADIQLRTGDAEATLDTLDKALTLINESGERTAEGEVFLMQGLALTHARARKADAEIALSRALKAAQADGAAAIEKRAAAELQELQA